MTRDEAISVVVRAGREGRKELLKALIEEMNGQDMEKILRDEGWTEA